MKKALAIVMALVIALSMSAMAFAGTDDDKAPTTPATATPNEVCGICGSSFNAAEDLRDHLKQGCDGHNATQAPEYDAYVDLTVKDLLTMIIDLVKINAGQWDAIESVIIRLVDFVENMGKGLVAAAEVEGAVADLEAELANFSIPGVDELLNALKSKIKNMYAGEKATTVVETTTETTTEETTTEAVVIEDTGSASVGIAAFAAISVAAAAAYVCTKKKA